MCRPDPLVFDDPDSLRFFWLGNNLRKELMAAARTETFSSGDVDQAKNKCLSPSAASYFTNVSLQDLVFRDDPKFSVERALKANGLFFLSARSVSDPNITAKAQPSPASPTHSATGNSSTSAREKNSSLTSTS
jgi:hypothetical protein